MINSYISALWRSAKPRLVKKINIVQVIANLYSQFFSTIVQLCHDVINGMSITNSVGYLLSKFFFNLTTLFPNRNLHFHSSVLTNYILKI
jgi:phage-related protein